jgi:uncharacterized protein YxjI
MNECPECGEEIIFTDNNSPEFCERCGFKLPPEFKTSRPLGERKNPKITGDLGTLPLNKGNMQIPDQSSTHGNLPKKTTPKESIFGPQRLYYLIQDYRWAGEKSPIKAEMGQILGQLERHNLSVRRIVEIRENSGEIGLSIHHKILTMKQGYTLSTADGTLLGRVPTGLISLLKPKFILYTPDNLELLVARGNFFQHEYAITYENNQAMPIAYVRQGKDLRNFLPEASINADHTFFIRIIDPTADRRLIMGLVLSIEDKLHNLT